MSNRRLYIVRVEFEYAVMAESENEAKNSPRLAIHELNYSEVDMSARLARTDRREFQPMNWDDDESGVYTGPRNTHDTISWNDAVSADKAAEESSKV